MAFSFEWDEVNTAKVRAHGVSPDEAELVFFANDAFSMSARPKTSSASPLRIGSTR